MLKNVLTNFAFAITLVASANAQMHYGEFVAGRGGDILREIAETEQIYKNQVQELFFISQNLTGGILTIRNALICMFPNGTSETESITENQSKLVSELYGALCGLAYQTTN